MTKIRVVSDLHLEFELGRTRLSGTPEFIELPNPNREVEVLLLSGDIAIADKIDRFISFFEKVAGDYAHVCYIAGNHEFYKGEIDTGIDKLREGLKDFPNIHILDSQFHEVNENLVVLGTTLWTDFDRGNPVSLMVARNKMNDFNLIRVAKNGYSRFSPEMAYGLHNRSLHWLEGTLGTFEASRPDTKVIVMTHQAPSFQSISNNYRSSDVNGAYASNLEHVILANKNIKLWVHGHIHESKDYMVGDTTRVVCNPRGYVPYDTNHGFDKNLIIEV